MYKKIMVFTFIIFGSLTNVYADSDLVSFIHNQLVVTCIKNPDRPQITPNYKLEKFCGCVADMEYYGVTNEPRFKKCFNAVVTGTTDKNCTQETKKVIENISINGCK